MSASRRVGLQSVDLKWLPVIAHDDCVGCNRCVLACRPRCLELVWDFATLVRPEDCGGCGRCAEACLHGVIKMDWCPRPAVARAAPGRPPQAGDDPRAPGRLFRWHRKP